MSKLRLCILGTTSLRKSDETYDQSFLTGSKRLALLTYLLIARPRGYHRRDKILALFWPEKGQKNARNALSNMLYHLRNSLNDNVVLNRGTEEISINRKQIWCDVTAFEQFLDEGEVRKALELYRDDLLVGFHVPDISNELQSWLDGERERLRQRAAEGAWILAEEAEQNNDRKMARKWANRAAEYLPYSGETQQRLIALLKRNGDRAGAREAYDRYAERLRTEWDMEPTDKLKALVENMEVQEPGRHGAAEPKSEQPPITSSGEIPKDKSSHGTADSTPVYLGQEEDTASGISNSMKWSAVAGLLILVAVAIWAFWSGTMAGGTEMPVNEGRSVAVLPFTYLGTEDSTDYFSLGMTEEILTRLAQVGDLSVISRTSVMQYRNTQKSLREIADELGVSVVVEGSVQRVDEQVRISAQLIDAGTDRHLWAKSYNGSIRNILALQSEVARNIADELHAELLPREREQLETQRQVDEMAYHLYLRAQHLRDRRDSAGITRAISLFREAISRDSAFAPAHGGLAISSFWSGLFRLTPRNKAGPVALEAADRALMLDSTNVEAYLAKALVEQIYYRNWEESEQALRQAIAINPSHSELRSEYGWLLLRLGRVEESITQMRRAVTGDPRSWHAHQSLGYAIYCNYQFEEAIQELETAISIEPRYYSQFLYLYHALLKQSQRLYRQGNGEDARAVLKRLHDIYPNLILEDNMGEDLIEMVIRGEEQEALEQVEQASMPPIMKKILFLFAGENKEALDIMDKFTSFDSIVFADPIYDPVRDDPRFEEMVERKLSLQIEPF
ncbi:MAG: BTAD domain-containing putative transcriptional regulator [Balneolaceae bacterium]|nr:BTAD domain-containing putative transcriptional regulator [Balneolaceae bacterium]